MIAIAFLSLFCLQVQAMNLNYRKAPKRYQSIQSRPNILILMVDEWRYPVLYEDEDLIQWQRDNLRTVTFLQENGVKFNNYYCSTTACNPGRATIFTGQYPSLHGVSQTTGAAKLPTDPTMYWLSPGTVPTAGNIFLEGGYANYYIGKWHVADINLYNPGTKKFILSYDSVTGIVNQQLVDIYKNANMLSPYGFNNGWVGPEPEGNEPHETGSSAGVGVSGRDIYYADEAIRLLSQWNTESSTLQPWFMVCSFTNPHDICLYGNVLKDDPDYKFEIDSSLPSIPPAPTADEDLSTKPLAQQSYKDEYPKVFQPTTDTQDYRQLYYSLQKNVDMQMGRVLDQLLQSKFKNNTIVVFMSDHGSLVGAHGLFQKFFNIYEETVHIPLIFYAPTLLSVGVEVDLLTSHVDFLPTLCGLADINVDAITTGFASTYTNSRTLVGRDLSKLVLGTASISEINALKEPLLFQTYDQVFTGASTVGPIGAHFSYVIQPAFIEAVITTLDGNIWKLARYYEDESFATPLTCTCSDPVVPADPAVQYEMYNLADDPYEMYNLADPAYSTIESSIIQEYLLVLLEQQLAEKALHPQDYDN